MRGLEFILRSLSSIISSEWGVSTLNILQGYYANILRFGDLSKRGEGIYLFYISYGQLGDEPVYMLVLFEPMRAGIKLIFLGWLDWTDLDILGEWVISKP